MKVRLISVTPEAEKLIIYIARVSNPANQDNPDIARLVRYLLDKKHWSPFEHATATFEIETSRAIAAQLLRHRSFSFQEFSLRYSAAEGWEPFELRKQAEKNRQSSTEVFDPAFMQKTDFYDSDGNVLWGYDEVSSSRIVENLLKYSFSVYNKLIELGVAKESARFILPLATTTRLYMTGNLRSWIHYIALRTDEHTQKEHREIAKAIKAIFVEQFPTISEALAWRQ